MKIFGTDFDGVIINIEPQKAAAFAELVNNEWGIDKDAAYNCWHDFCGTSRRFKFDYFYKKKFGEKLDDKTYQLIEPQLSMILKTKYYPSAQFLPGALEMLKFARENFDYCFVSSGVPMAEIKYLLDLLDVSKYYDSILGTDNIYKSKADHFRKILGGKHYDPLIFIADGIEDMKVAKEFNAKTIGVTTNHTGKELKKAGATITCETPLEAIPLIKSFLNQ